MNKQKVFERINPLFLKGICHRGLHNEEFCENGLNAFRNAIEHNMAFEFDVHLTKDNELVVIHDSDTKRMTGKEGIIEELTLEEIKTGYRLNDGEEIPTLKEVLELTAEKVPVVLELKVYKNNHKLLASRVAQEISVIKDKKNIVLISFYPKALLCFNHKGYVRQLLVADCYQKMWKYHVCFEGADLEWCMLNHKKFRKYAAKHFTNIWTVDEAHVFENFAPLVDTVTFQGISAEEVKLFYSRDNKSI